MRSFFANLKSKPAFVSFAALIIAVVSAFCGLVAVAADGDETPAPKLKIAVSPERIYQGEATRLYIQVENLENAEIPDVGYLSERFDVEYLGATNSSSSRVSFVGGVQRRVEEKGVLFNFVLTPKTSGTLTIEPPKIVASGKTLDAQSVSLQVVPLSTTDLVAVETTISSNKQVFPLVPFEVVVDVYVKDVPEKYREVDPITFVSRNLAVPQLTIPWFESRSVADATVPDVSLEDWLGELRADSGFAINNYSFSDPFDFGFSMFEERRPTTFLPKKERVERPDANGATASYWKYSFKRRMRAKKPGILSFPAVSLKGVFLTSDADGKNSSQNIYVASQPTKIEVAPIPENTAPENYVGIFGKIRWDVGVSAKSAAVGEALTLTATLRGYGAFDAAKAPNISELAGFRNAFKTYPPTERALDDGVAFEYKIRPTAPGKTTIPAIEISYFDVEQGRFIAANSAPIEIDVRQSLLTEDENDENDDESNDESALNAAESTAQAGVRPTFSVKTLRIAFVGIGGAILFVGLFFIGRVLVRANVRRVALGNRRIVDAARSQLELGLSKIDAQPAEGLAFVRLAFLQLVRKRFAQPIDSLTDAEVVDFLRREFGTKKKSVDASRQNEDAATLTLLLDFFQRAELVRFGGANVLDGNFRSKTRELFRRWVDFLKSRTKKLASWAGADDVSNSNTFRSNDVKNVYGDDVNR